MNAINNGFDVKTWKEVEESLDRMLERKDLGQTEKMQNKLIQPRIVFQVEELDLRENRRELEQTAEAALRLQTIVNNISFGGIKEELSELSEISNLAGTLFDGFELPEIQSVTKDIHALNEELKTLQSYGFWKVVGQGGDTDVYGNTSTQDVSGPMLNGAMTYGGTFYIREEVYIMKCDEIIKYIIIYDKRGPPKRNFSKDYCRNTHFVIL